MELTFRRLRRADFSLLRGWLAQPHVARWWNHGITPEAVEADFGAPVDGADPTDIFVVMAEKRPIGLVQRYLFDDNPEYVTELAPLLVAQNEALSMDYLVGEPDALRRGVGAGMIRESVKAIWRDYPSAPAVIVPVNAANEASWRALERAGFKRVAEGLLGPDNPIDDRAHYVYHINRPIDLS
ncbi:MAG: acetyltransferase [Pseudomonadota bacterium]|nr:acetyltransferase [Pseudomonadota bacterium]